MLSFHEIAALAAHPAVLAAPVPVNQLLSGESAVPNPIIVIAVSIFLIKFIGWLGRRLPPVKKVDNIARIVVAVLGIAIPIATIPFIRDVFTIFSTLIQAGTANSNARTWAFAGYSAVTLGLAAIGIWILYSSRERDLPRNALIMALFSGFLFLGLPYVQTAASWYINNIAINFFWAFFLGIYHFGLAHHLRLS